MAHGLVLRMQDYLENLNNSGEIVQDSSLLPIEEPDESVAVQIIQSWIQVAKNSKNSKMEFLSLLRETLLFILSPDWVKCTKQNDLLYAFSSYYKKFSTITKNVNLIYYSVCQLSTDPWKNNFFEWDSLSSGKLKITDKAVQSYFCQEPEEIVLARVQTFVKSRKLHAALCLAKLSFLFQSREKRNIANPYKPITICKSGSISYPKDRVGEGLASIDWYVVLLNRMTSISFVTQEVSQLNCHEGVEIICRMRRNSRMKNICFMLLQIFVIQDLIEPSKYCCTEKLYSLFCLLHKERKSSMREITESAEKILAAHAPSSAHLYLFVDTMWKYFGPKFMSLYVEFYVRGLTADINYLETVKTSNHSQGISIIEEHIALILKKLSSLFNGSLEDVVRECVFSAFILQPSKNKLLVLKTLTDRLHAKEDSAGSNNELTFRDCNCNRICNGCCKSSNSYGDFIHPLLKMGIRNIPYSLVKDLVSVLESVRCMNFQYNLFNWRSGFSKLVQFLKLSVKNKHEANDKFEFSQIKDINKMPSEDESIVETCSDKTVKLLTPNALIKRKNSLDNTESEFLAVAANIEVHCEDKASKKVKISHPIMQNQIDKEAIIGSIPKLKMNDAIEKVIRLSLSDKITKEQTNVFTNATTANISNFERIAPNKFQNIKNSNLFSPNLNKNVQKSVRVQQFSKNSYNSAKLSFSSDSVKQNLSERRIPNILKHSSGRPSVLMKAVNPLVKERNNSLLKNELPLSLQKSVTETFSTPGFMTAIRSEPLLQLRNESLRSECKPLNYFSKSNEHLLDLQQNEKKGLFDPDILNLSSKYSTLKNFEPQLQTSKYTTQLPLNLKCNVSSVESGRKFNPSVSNLYEVNSIVNKGNQIAEAHQTSKKNFDERKSDRNSVIQHTMQHLGIKIPNQLSVSFNSNAAQQMKIVSLNDSANLTTFSVNLQDKNISKQNILPANVEIYHQQSFNNTSTTSASNLEKKDTVSIPSIQASPTVIRKNPWEMSHQNKVEVKKVYTSSMKKTYPHPYEIQPNEFIRKSEKITERETVYQIYKTKQVSNQKKIAPQQQETMFNLNSSPGTPHSLFFKSNSLNKSHMNDQNLSQTRPNISSFKTPSTCSYTYKNSSEVKSAYTSESAQSSKQSEMKPSVDLSELSKGKVLISNNLQQMANNQIQINSSNPTSILQTSLTSSHQLHSFIENKYLDGQIKSKSSSATCGIPYKSNCSARASTSFVSNSYSNAGISQCDSSQNSVTSYDSSLYSSPVLCEDDKGVIFKAVKTDVQENISDICCSPFEVNPCQSCSLSVESKNVDREQMYSKPNDPSTDISYLDNQIQDDFNDTKNDIKKIFEKPYSLFHYPAEKYITCKLCSITCTSSDYELHRQNFHPNEVMDNNELKLESSNSDNLEPLNFDTAALDFIPQNFTDEDFGENKNMSEIIETAENQSVANTCMNLINSTPFDQMVEYFHNVANSVPNTGDPFKISDVLNEDLQNNNLREVKNNSSPSNAGNTSRENAINENNANIDEMLEFFNSNSLEQNILHSSSFIPGNLEKNYASEQLISNKITENIVIKKKLIKSLMCKKCLKKFSARGSIRKHILHFHPEIKVEECIVKCAGLESGAKKSNAALDNSLLPKTLKKEVNFNNIASPMEKQTYANNQNKMLDFNHRTIDIKTIKTNMPLIKRSESLVVLEGRSEQTKKVNKANSSFLPPIIKKTKQPLKECIYCGKMLTIPYMKYHILKVHLSLSNKPLPSVSLPHTSDNLCSSLLVDKALSKDYSALNLPSNVLSDNLDSNTCLSVSHALKSEEKHFNSSMNNDLAHAVKELTVTRESTVLNLCETVPFYEDNIESSNKINDFPQSTFISSHSSELDKSLQLDDIHHLPHQNFENNKVMCHLCSEQFSSQSFLSEHFRTCHPIHLVNESGDDLWREVESPLNMCNTSALESSCDLTSKTPNSHVEQPAFMTLTKGNLYQNGREYKSEESYKHKTADFLNPNSLFSTDNFCISPNNDHNKFSSSNDIQYENSSNLVKNDEIELNAPSCSEGKKNTELISCKGDCVSTIEMNNCNENQTFIKNNDASSDQSLLASYKNKDNLKVQFNKLSKKKKLESKVTETSSKMPVCRQPFLKLSCKFCSKSYYNKTCFIKHLKLKHNKIAFGNTFKTFIRSGIVNDEKLIGSDAPNSEPEKFQPVSKNTPVFQKNINSIKLTNKTNLNDPLYEHVKSNEKVKCKICFKVYSNRGNLKTHMKNLHNFNKSKEKSGKTVQCHICLKLLVHSSLKTHIKLRHDGISMDDDQKAMTVSTIAELSSINYCKKDDQSFSDDLSVCNLQNKECNDSIKTDDDRKNEFTERTVKSLQTYELSYDSSHTKDSLNFSDSIEESSFSDNIYSTEKQQTDPDKLLEIDTVECTQKETLNSSNENSECNDAFLQNKIYDKTDDKHNFSSILVNSSNSKYMGCYEKKYDNSPKIDHLKQMESMNLLSNCQNEVEDESDFTFDVTKTNKNENNFSEACIATVSLEETDTVSGDDFKNNTLSLSQKKTFDEEINCEKEDSFTYQMIEDQASDTSSNIDLMHKTKQFIKKNVAKCADSKVAFKDEHILDKFSSQNQNSKFNFVKELKNSCHELFSTYLEKSYVEKQTRAPQNNNPESCIPPAEKADTAPEFKSDLLLNEKSIPTANDAFDQKNICLNEYVATEIPDSRVSDVYMENSKFILKIDDVPELKFSDEILSKNNNVSNLSNEVKSLDSKDMSELNASYSSVNYDKISNVLSLNKGSDLFCHVMESATNEEMDLKGEILSDAMELEKNKISEKYNIGSQNLKETEAKCRLCHKKFKSMKFLSKHLKIAHKIPFLKRQKTSKSNKNSLTIEENKLSPPLLLHQNYGSDSTLTFANVKQSGNSEAELLIVSKKIHDSTHKEKMKEECETTLSHTKTDSKISDQIIKVKQSNSLHLNKYYNDVGINCQIESFKKRKCPEQESDLEDSTRICQNISGYQKNFDSVHDDDISVSNATEEFRHVGINCNLSPLKSTVRANFSEEPSCSKARILPCIIKIWKKRGNSIVYRIGNSNTVSSPTTNRNSSVRKNESSPCIKRYKANKKVKQNTSKIFNRKTSANFSAYSKSCKYAFNNIFTRKSFSFFHTNKRSLIKKPRTFFRKSGILQKVKKIKRTSQTLLTFKYPDDVRNFFKHHKQPIVLLKRLNEEALKNCGLKNGFKVSPDSSVSMRDFCATGEKSAVVKLEKLDMSSIKRPLHSVPTNFLESNNDSDVNTLESNISNYKEKLFVNKTALKLKHIQNSIRQEKNDAVIVLRKIHNSDGLYIENGENYSIHTRPNYTSISVQKDYQQLSILRECKVVLNKLPL